MRISDWSSDVCSSDLRELAGQAQLARCGLAALLLLLAPALALVGALDDALEQHAGPFGMAGEPVIEVILDRGLDQLARRHDDQLLLRLPLVLRVAADQRQLGVGDAAAEVGQEGRRAGTTDVIKVRSRGRPL